MRGEEPLWLSLVDAVGDVVFVLDVVLNFHTAFIRNHTLITDKGEIARGYLRSWFLIDAVGSIPWTLMMFVVKYALGAAYETADLKSGDFVQMVKFLKVPKLLRICNVATQRLKRLVLLFCLPAAHRLCGEPSFHASVQDSSSSASRVWRARRRSGASCCCLDCCCSSSIGCRASTSYWPTTRAAGSPSSCATSSRR